MSVPTPSAAPGRRPFCFVLMPFGTKTDLAAGKVQFDAVYGEIIRPAAEAAGMQCVRADEEKVGGIIHLPMFERLLLCEYAVADLSLANANVYYELGIRHATRPWSTVLLFRDGFRLPFDVGPLRGMPYRLDAAGRPAREHVESDRAALTAHLRDARAHQTDSPLFQLLDLTPPDLSTLATELFRERVEQTTALQERLASARRTRDVAAMRAVRADLGDLGDAETGLVVDLLQSLLAGEAYADAVGLVGALPEVVRRTPLVREKLAFALNRLGRRAEAETVLLALIADRGADSETYGLLGRVYKDQWDDARTAGAGPARARGLLDKAITAYLDGFAADWRDHYPGINAVQLMHLRDPDDPRIAELLPVVRYGARQKALRRQADYWDHATLLEVAILDDDPDDAWGALALALATDPLPWQARTTLASLVRLREARERTAGPAAGWLREVEAELSAVAGLPE